MSRKQKRTRRHHRSWLLALILAFSSTLVLFLYRQSGNLYQSASINRIAVEDPSTARSSAELKIINQLNTAAQRESRVRSTQQKEAAVVELLVTGQALDNLQQETQIASGPVRTAEDYLTEAKIQLIEGDYLDSSGNNLGANETASSLKVSAQASPAPRPDSEAKCIQAKGWWSDKVCYLEGNRGGGGYIACPPGKGSSLPYWHWFLGSSCNKTVSADSAAADQPASSSETPDLTPTELGDRFAPITDDYVCALEGGRWQSRTHTCLAPLNGSSDIKCPYHTKCSRDNLYTCTVVDGRLSLRQTPCANGCDARVKPAICKPAPLDQPQKDDSTVVLPSPQSPRCQPKTVNLGCGARGRQETICNPNAELHRQTLFDCTVTESCLVSDFCRAQAAKGKSCDPANPIACTRGLEVCLSSAGGSYCVKSTEPAVVAVATPNGTRRCSNGNLETFINESWTVSSKCSSDCGQLNGTYQCLAPVPNQPKLKFGDSCVLGLFGWGNTCRDCPGGEGNTHRVSGPSGTGAIICGPSPASPSPSPLRSPQSLPSPQPHSSPSAGSGTKCGTVSRNDSVCGEGKCDEWKWAGLNSGWYCSSAELITDGNTTSLTLSSPQPVPSPYNPRQACADRGIGWKWIESLRLCARYGDSPFLSSPKPSVKPSQDSDFPDPLTIPTDIELNLADNAGILGQTSADIARLISKCQAAGNLGGAALSDCFCHATDCRPGSPGYRIADYLLDNSGDANGLQCVEFASIVTAAVLKSSPICERDKASEIDRSCLPAVESNGWAFCEAPSALYADDVVIFPSRFTGDPGHIGICADANGGGTCNLADANYQVDNRALVHPISTENVKGVWRRVKVGDSRLKGCWTTQNQSL